MKQRTKQPANNKYYIRKASGGLNAAIKGEPTIKGADVLCNCVGYANGRFNEAANDPFLEGKNANKAFKWQLTCNAENFIESAKKQGLKVSKVPTTGGIMVWQKGNTLGGGDGAGHVAFVEAVYTDGTITTSESGYKAYTFKRVRRSNKNGRWGAGDGYKFRGCIINPYIKNVKIAPPADKAAAKPATTKQTTAQKIVAAAKSYCWPYGTPKKKYAYKTGSAKKAYKAALKKYCGKKAKISQTDCGYFVNTCVRAAGVKKFDSLPDRATQSYPKLVAGMKIVRKGKTIPKGFLKPGDVIRYKKKNGHQHTLIYYSSGKIAEAGRSHWFPAIKKDTKKYNNKKSVKISTLQVLRAK